MDLGARHGSGLSRRRPDVGARRSARPVHSNRHAASSFAGGGASRGGRLLPWQQPVVIRCSGASTSVASTT
ncbi:hypothetical protein [Sorangium sp. So ce1097]|uniref:hypothetical protein n=1 Tax=Sorangium sp. So ce1097 TaxID=3133330 RepID=UPI003F5E99A8